MGRRWRVLSRIGLSLLVAVSLASVTLYAQRPGGGPGGREGGMRRGMGGMNPRMMVERAIEGSWAFVALELDTTDEQLVQLRQTYRKAWADARKDLEGFREASPEDRRAMMEGLVESQKALREAVKAQLTEEQAAKLDEWYKRQWERSRGGRRGGGRPQRPNR